MSEVIAAGAEAAVPVLQVEHAQFRLDRRTAAVLAAGGRFLAVWLPVFAFCSHQAGMSGPLTLGLALVWMLALQGAFLAERPARVAIGSAVGAAVGSVVGLALVTAAIAMIRGRASGSLLAQTAVGVMFSSWVWERFVGSAVASRRTVMVVGGGDAVASVLEQLGSLRYSPFRVVGVVEDDEMWVGETRVVGPVSELDRLAAEIRPDIVVVGRQDGRVVETLIEQAQLGFRVLSLPELCELAFGRVPVETVDAQWFMNALHLYHNVYSRLSKRLFDVAVGVVGIVLTCWLFPLLWVAVKLTGGPGPVVFRQVRLGEGGRTFTILKFRTMRQDAEWAGAMWAATNDPRITGLGRLMRKTRLDELPQLINVLRGEMSIVGPRPERPEFLEQLRDTVPFWTRRHLVKPGITGWAQISRGYTADISGTAEKLSYDLWYLRHRSLLVDLTICAKTFTTLVSGNGAR